MLSKSHFPRLSQDFRLVTHGLRREKDTASAPFEEVRESCSGFVENPLGKARDLEKSQV